LPIGTGTHRSCEPNPASFGALGAGVGASALALESAAPALASAPAPKASTLGEAVVFAVEGGGDGDPVLTCGVMNAVVPPTVEGEDAILAALGAVGVFACLSYAITFGGFAGMYGMGTMLVALI
jgi:hypothetical protein